VFASAAAVVFGVRAGGQGQVQFAKLLLDISPRGAGFLVCAFQPLLGG
jgi:hypothetical protein